MLAPTIGLPGGYDHRGLLSRVLTGDSYTGRRPAKAMVGAPAIRLPVGLESLASQGVDRCIEVQI